MSRAPRIAPTLLACAAALPGAAFAEGNRLVLSCETVPGAETDAAVPGLPNQPTSFTIEPTSIDADGIGKVNIIGPDGLAHQGAAAGFTGAFVWTADGVINVLTLTETVSSGAVQVLWIRTDETPPDPDEPTPDTGANASDQIRTELICKAS